MTERMSPAEYNAMVAAGKKKPGGRYGVKKKGGTVIDGIRFDSPAEARRYVELKALKAAGEIEGEIECQPRYDIVIDGEPVKTEAGRILHARFDFRYWRTEPRERVVEDVKGVRTPEFNIKRALVEHLYGIRIVLIGNERGKK